jgi:hypothetical protein
VVEREYLQEKEAVKKEFEVREEFKMQQWTAMFLTFK